MTSYSSLCTFYLSKRAFSEECDTQKKENIFMEKFKEYRMRRFKGIATRRTCPVCKVKHCFILYLNIKTGEPINFKVGKCDRVKECGYHLTPKKYFTIYQ